MARPENVLNLNTPISIKKTQKIRMRKYAQPDKNRKGNESDEIVFERILQKFEEIHPINCDPKPTYNTKA